MGEFEDRLTSILSSPDEMNKIMDLARTLSSSLGEGSNDADKSGGQQDGTVNDHALSAAGFANLDPRLIQLIGRIMSEYTATRDDDKAVLLSSIKPYLKEYRRETIDKAIEILRLSRIAKIALREFGGDLHL